MEDLIVSDPKVMMGKPVIRGTRITVEILLDTFHDGRNGFLFAVGVTVAHAPPDAMPLVYTRPVIHQRTCACP